MKKNKLKIIVFGLGYVGLAMSTLLALKNEVLAVDIDADKISNINKRISPIKDEIIEKYFKEKELNLVAYKNNEITYDDADFVVIATPTNYVCENDSFDTSSIEKIIKDVLAHNDKAYIVIKSTIPVGYTTLIRNKYNTNRILFSPEFLRESKALYDNLYPSRIIVGVDTNDKNNVEAGMVFANLLGNCAKKDNIDIVLMELDEAEAVKLFSNTYLALRIAFFNELDSYAESKGLNSKSIITGICLDPRIGNYYNNPSFGYGGYCLPKDTKQLLSNYEDIPQKLITAIVESNDMRKDFISNRIFKMVDTANAKIIGIYGLTMKTDSDNFRESSIHYIIDKLKEKDLKIIIYEPHLNSKEQFSDCIVVNKIDEFKSQADLIIANRNNECLKNVKNKIYTRDIFHRD